MADLTSKKAVDTWSLCIGLTAATLSLWGSISGHGVRWLGTVGHFSLVFAAWVYMQFQGVPGE